MKPASGFAALASLVLTLPAVLAQETPPPGQIVELPKFVVTDSRELPPPESWKYATMPGFEILTNASDKATQRLVKDFDEFRQALSIVWPIEQQISQTTSLILSGKGAKFDAFTPKGPGALDTTTASLFLKEGNKTAILIDLQATTLNVLNVDGIDDAATGTDSGLLQVDHDRALYREYVRYLLSKSNPRMPAWFEEGISQIIMRMQIHSRRYIELGRVEPANTISASAAMTQQMNALAAADDPDAPQLPGAPAEDKDFPAALMRRRLIDMEKMFSVAHGSPEATNTLGNNIWAKQSYAFVHMCLYGEKGKFQKPFAQFLQRIAREPVTEAMFKECFKMTYKQMLMQIRGYAESTYSEIKIYQSKKGGEDLIIAPKPLALREATQSEIGRIKGEALVLAGHREKAKTELSAPYVRGERDPELLAALGLYEKQSGKDADARKFLEAAWTGKTTRPDALLELARFRYADALAKPEGSEKMLSPAQVRSVVDLLLVARKQPPHNVAIYDLMADTWARSAVRPKPDEARPIVEGAVLFPMRLKLVYQAIFFSVDMGDLKSAHALADHGIRFSPDATVKKRFEDAKAQLPPAPAGAAEPQKAEAKK